MLMKELRGDDIVAVDGRIGSLDDLYIDDECWIVRYLVVDTGAWLPGRRVLLPPQLAAPPGPGAQAIPVALTREQVQNSPGVAADPAMSDLYEQARAQRHGERSYWEGHVPLNASAAQYPAPFGAEHPDARAEDKAARAENAARQSHLCSASELLGYSVVGYDGACGRIEDLVVDERRWDIPGVLVDTGKGLASRKVLVRPGAIDHIDWEHRVVHVALTHQQVERSPPAI